jgi:hypothetical protein
MQRLVYLIFVFLGILRSAAAQTIPKELWGTWVVRREVPTTTISCWGEKEAGKLIGSEIEYSAGVYRWNKIVTKDPKAATTSISADQFHDENSGGGANDSKVNLEQLGIKSDKVTQIVIQHPEANLTGATIEIPGDRVFLKDKNTIIFSVCNVYFEAKRSPGAIGNFAAERCGIGEEKPAQGIFADPDGKHGWHEYRNVKDIPELEQGLGQFAASWTSPEGKLLIKLQEPGEDFYAYTDYCFNKAGRLIALRFELRTAWGWGFLEDGPIAGGVLKPRTSLFFDTENEATIPKPDQSAEIPEALHPQIYHQKSRLPFAKLLPK